MQKEKVRLYLIAREIDVDSKDLVDLCKSQGWDVKNQLSSIEPEQRDILVQMIKAGGSRAAAAPPAAPVRPAIPTPPRPVRPLITPKPAAPPKAEPEPVQKAPAAPEPAPAAPEPAPAAPEPKPAPIVSAEPTAPKAVAEPKAPVVAPATPAARPTIPAINRPLPNLGSPRPSMPNLGGPRPNPAMRPPTPGVPPPPKPPSAGSIATPSAAPTPRPSGLPRPQGSLPSRPAGDFAPTPRPGGAPPRPAGDFTPRPGGPIPRPAGDFSPRPPTPLSPARGDAGSGAAPDQQGPASGAPRPGSPSQLGGNPQRLRNLDSNRPSSGAPGGAQGAPGGERRQPRIMTRPGMIRVQPPAPLKQHGVEAPAQRAQPSQAPTPTGPRKLAEIPKDFVPGQGRIEDLTRSIQADKLRVDAPPTPVDEEDEEGKAAKKPGSVAGRADRHRERVDRQARRVDTGHKVRLDRIDDEDGPRRRSGRKPQRLKGPQPRKGKVPITLPITVRSLSEAIGMKTGELLMKLMGQGIMGLNINSTVETDLALLMALELGIELEVKAKESREDELLRHFAIEDTDEQLKPRAPIVTIMGHVDHGKTSLLDKIRKSNVVSTEAGGITQVLRAWRVMHNDKPITFLDTPGHEAFTKMRARGANVTDIAVIVCAADDGVMPQTEEAISHAKAAGVKIVVAINKCDLPGANIQKARQQLYGLELVPDNMGGDVPFVETSAATGKGIDELLETLSIVAELENFRANPNKPASGVCLEAHISEGQGVTATMLIESGTLKKGDVVLCGTSYGRVRMLYDDQGKQLDNAGPTVPVRLLGLDSVPNADDPFLVVPELTVAREIAESRKADTQEEAAIRRPTLNFNVPGQDAVMELKVILKADFRGSLEAIRKELEKLEHDEVKVRVLHAAVGGITESDVTLALTSPQDTLILGFNSVPDSRASALAEEKGVSIREYSIIYKLTEDLRAALEGRLKPREEVVHLGRAMVREVFKITRVGAIAGCFVTQGVIERNAKVRLIRRGVVVFPPAERTVGLESLKRFKDDVKDVREGMECGIKIAGFDDVKVDDVIEAYRIDQVMRTL
ncbi:MAG: translation initiation factor IF-2 [Planctomycetota bacterium]|nr:MAG: translation initiation factor IF-2 [Planctomycetota bacterium]